MDRDEQDETTIYQSRNKSRGAILKLARRPGKPSRLEERWQERSEGGMSDLHQGSMDGYEDGWL